MASRSQPPGDYADDAAPKPHRAVTVQPGGTGWAKVVAPIVLVLLAHVGSMLWFLRGLQGQVELANAAIVAAVQRGDEQASRLTAAVAANQRTAENNRAEVSSILTELRHDIVANREAFVRLLIKCERIKAGACADED